MRTQILTTTIALALITSVLAQETAVPVEVARTPTYSEAPVFDKEGNLYISEPYRGPITQVTPAGEIRIWAETTGANGHRILDDGTHLVCDRIRQVILKLSPTGKEIGEVTSDCEGKPLRAPNDLVLDTHGGFYFTDPRHEEDSIGRVGYVDASGQSHQVAEWVGYPNGIALSADGQVLYVAASMKNEIWSFPIHSPGKIGPPEVFSQLPEREDGEFAGPDGIAFDEDGNLYVAHFGMGQVQVINPQGNLIRSLPAGQGFVSNVAFSGPNGNQLYMTGSPKGQIQEKGVVYMLDLGEAFYEFSKK